MVSITPIKNGIRQFKVSVTKADFNTTVANQTAQGILLFTLPYGSTIIDAHIINSGNTWTSSGTLTNLNVLLGKTSGGNEYLTSTDLKTSAGSAINTGKIVPATAATQTVYLTATPVGSGSNWNTITSSGMVFDVYFTIVDYITTKPRLS